jgi:preprotein translocase subunit SecF
MHGLGFAGSLSFGDQVSWSLIGSLLAFNVGIELGQASVILLATPLLLLARRRRWSTTAQWTASGAIALCGVLWFVGRVA